MQSLRPRALNQQPKVGGWSNPNRGTRQQRGYGTEWDRIRPRIMDRDHYLCQTCLRAGLIKLGNIVDHRIPKAEGGTDNESNLEVICAPHHQVKTQAESRLGMGSGR